VCARVCGRQSPETNIVGTCPLIVDCGPKKHEIGGTQSTPERCSTQYSRHQTRSCPDTATSRVATRSSMYSLCRCCFRNTTCSLRRSPARHARLPERRSQYRYHVCLRLWHRIQTYQAISIYRARVPLLDPGVSRALGRENTPTPSTPFPLINQTSQTRLATRKHKRRSESTTQQYLDAKEQCPLHCHPSQ